jgi:tetratricopeptide (TPR) repeat protein
MTISDPFARPETQAPPVPLSPQQRAARWRFVKRVCAGLALAIAVVLAGLLVFGLVQRSRSQAAGDELVAQFADVEERVERGDDMLQLRAEVRAACERIEAGELEYSAQADARARIALARALRECSDFARSETFARDAVERARSLGGRHVELLSEALSELGSTLCARRRAKPAETALREALELQRGSAAVDDARTVRILRAQVLVAGVDRDFVRAESIAREALALNERVFGKGSDEAVDARSLLVNAWIDLGRDAEAEAELRELVTQRRELHAGDRVKLATDLHNLAFVLERRDALDESRTFYSEALAMKRRVRPEPNPSTGATLRNIAIDVWNRGDRTGAEPYLRFAIDEFDGSGEAGARGLISPLGELGKLLMQLGRHAEAEPYLRRALLLQRGAQERDDNRLVTRLQALALVLEKLDEPEAAEKLLREAVVVQRHAQPLDEALVSNALNRLATRIWYSGKNDEAEKLFREALAIRRRIFPGDHANVAVSLHNLAQLVRGRADDAEALALFEEALAMNRRLQPDGDSSTSGTASCLGALHLSRGELDQAEVLLREAVELKRKFVEDDRSRLTQALTDLALTLQGKHDFAGAEAFHRESLAIALTDLPASKLHLENSVAGLSVCAIAEKRYAEIEEQLLAARAALDEAELPTTRDRCTRTVVEFYVAWDVAEPGRGHAAAADRWRKQLLEHERAR